MGLFFAKFRSDTAENELSFSCLPDELRDAAEPVLGTPASAHVGRWPDQLGVAVPHGGRAAGADPDRSMQHTHTYTLPKIANMKHLIMFTKCWHVLATLATVAY